MLSAAFASRFTFVIIASLQLLHPSYRSIDKMRAFKHKALHLTGCTRFKLDVPPPGVRYSLDVNADSLAGIASSDMPPSTRLRASLRDSETLTFPSSSLMRYFEARASAERPSHIVVLHRRAGPSHERQPSMSSRHAQDQRKEFNAAPAHAEIKENATVDRWKLVLSDQQPAASRGCKTCFSGRAKRLARQNTVLVGPKYRVLHSFATHGTMETEREQGVAAVSRGRAVGSSGDRAQSA